MITEEDLIENGFTQYLLLGVGGVPVGTKDNPIYFYTNGRITVNVTEDWSWFLDGIQEDNDKIDSVYKLEKYIKEFGYKFRK